VKGAHSGRKGSLYRETLEIFFNLGPFSTLLKSYIHHLGYGEAMRSELRATSGEAMTTAPQLLEIIRAGCRLTLILPFGTFSHDRNIMAYNNPGGKE